MSNFAIEGLISGFNTTDLINAILDIQVRGPVKQIETRITKEQEKLTSFQALNAHLLSLDIGIGTLSNPTIFNGKQAKSSDPDVVSISASSSAELGNFNIQVLNVAKTDQISSKSFSDATEGLDKEGQFIVNGQTINVTKSDSLNTLANKISSASAGVKASVVRTAANQNKLVISATSTGVEKLELREVGTSGLLADFGLINPESFTYDYTVNANHEGAISNAYATGSTVTFASQTFSISDAGGLSTIDVTLDGTLTLQQIADQINTESTNQGGNIQASVIQDGMDERLLITSETGIPTKFVDNDNALFNLGVVSGVQSEEFRSSVITIAELMGFKDSSAGQFKLQAGDGSGEITVDVNFSEDTLQEIADKINTSADTAGSTLSAQIITANGLSRLEITSASGHPLIVDDSSNILNTLGIKDNDFLNYDQQGENSQFTFNGITINRSSNVVNDLLEGVSISLAKESSTVASISITEDHTGVTELVTNFVDSYNKVVSYLDEQTFFDPQNAKYGILFGNSTVRELQSALSNELSRTVPLLPSRKLYELNEGSGVSLGSIKITDRSGNSTTIDLTGAQTIQDVLDQINQTTDIKVQAEIGRSGVSINLIDSSGGAGIFKVEEVDGGTTARDLGILSQISSNEIAGSVIAEAGATSLDFIGIQVGTGGTIEFDKNKLEQALREHPDIVKNLLSAKGVGFARNFKETLYQFTAFGTGAIDTASKGIQERIDRFNKQVKRIEERAENYSRTLRKRFTALEVTMSKSQQMSQFLTEKLAANKQ
jgi:flagellar capping protein FliD